MGTPLIIIPTQLLLNQPNPLQQHLVDTCMYIFNVITLLIFIAIMYKKRCMGEVRMVSWGREKIKA